MIETQPPHKTGLHQLDVTDEKPRISVTSTQSKKELVSRGGSCPKQIFFTEICLLLLKPISPKTKDLERFQPQGCIVGELFLLENNYFSFAMFGGNPAVQKKNKKN